MKDVAQQTRTFQTVNLIPEIVINGCLEEDDLWIEHRPGVRFRPVAFNVSQGGWTNILRMSPGTQMPRHYHTAPVHGFTLQGEWRYLERAWRAPYRFCRRCQPGTAAPVPDDSGGDRHVCRGVAGGRHHVGLKAGFLFKGGDEALGFLGR